MALRRWTLLAPARYVDRDPFWTTFDLDTWAEEEYTWTPYPWNGLRDFARRPMATVEAGRGDCEDFALVAIAWAVANDRPGLGLAFCFEAWNPLPSHAIAFDDTHVYSSGDIVSTTVDDWLADTDQYRFALRRRVRT